MSERMGSGSCVAGWPLQGWRAGTVGIPATSFPRTSATRSGETRAGRESREHCSGETARRRERHSLYSSAGRADKCLERHVNIVWTLLRAVHAPLVIGQSRQIPHLLPELVLLFRPGRHGSGGRLGEEEKIASGPCPGVLGRGVSSLSEMREAPRPVGRGGLALKSGTCPSPTPEAWPLSHRFARRPCPGYVQSPTTRAKFRRMLPPARRRKICNREFEGGMRGWSESGGLSCVEGALRGVVHSSCSTGRKIFLNPASHENPRDIRGQQYNSNR